MSENKDPSIQRGPTGSRADKRSTPSNRQEAQKEARELGVDPRGMSTREIKEVVKAEREEQDEMRNFVTKTMEAAGWKPANPPQVTTPVVSSTTTADAPAPGPPPRVPPSPRPKSPPIAESDFIGDIIQWDGHMWRKCDIVPTQGCLIYFDVGYESWAILDKPVALETEKQFLTYDYESDRPLWSTDGNLPDGYSDGDILQWVSATPPTEASEGVPATEGNEAGWISAGIAPADNDLLYYDGETKRWKTVGSPSSTGTYIPGCVNGVMQWLSTSECT